MPWRSPSRLRSEPGAAARQAPFAGGRLLTVMMPRGYYRPQPVHRSSGIAVVETTAAFRNRPDGLRKQLGLSCRWLYGAVRQQCAGHLPFKRRETANGGFSVLPTGTTDPYA